MILYDLQDCYDLINRYTDLNGEVFEIEQGSLGLGVIFLKAENCKWCIIEEVSLNCWSSAHTIKLRKKLSKKDEKRLEDAERRIEEEELESED
jgi:hypothetical protein